VSGANSGPPCSLTEIASQLAVQGPVRIEPTNRRIRGLLCGVWVFDTTEAQYVWQHQHCKLQFTIASWEQGTQRSANTLADPYYYVPLKALEAGPGTVTKKETDPRGFWIGTLSQGHKTGEIAGFTTGVLEGLVKINTTALDDWYSEDERLLGPHPKDPYTRIECLPSSRSIRVEVDGTTIARSTYAVHLHETRLRTRYYLPRTAVLDWKLLVPSETKSFCPYKGEAEYYHIKVGDRLVKDAIWYYSYPLPESAQIQNLLAFWNEKVDIFIDGIKEQK
jgi:uncharacterized protein (DUF427 family)